VNYGSKGVGAHSVYIQTYYEMGIVGLLCYVWVYVGLMLAALRNFRRDSKGVIMIGAIILTYMVQNYSDNILDYGSLNLYFWGIMGTVLAKWNRQAALSRRTGIVEDRIQARPLTEV
jgi:O-antigen ligase